jgi:hypothetical protein
MQFIVILQVEMMPCREQSLDWTSGTQGVELLVLEILVMMSCRWPTHGQVIGHGSSTIEQLVTTSCGRVIGHSLIH